MGILVSLCQRNDYTMNTWQSLSLHCVPNLWGTNNSLLWDHHLNKPFTLNNSWYKPFPDRSQKVIFQHSICLTCLRFQNVNQLKGKTNARLKESHPVKMKLVTTLPYNCMSHNILWSNDGSSVEFLPNCGQ